MTNKKTALILVGAVIFFRSPRGVTFCYRTKSNQKCGVIYFLR